MLFSSFLYSFSVLKNLVLDMKNIVFEIEKNKYFFLFFVEKSFLFREMWLFLNMWTDWKINIYKVLI